MKASDERPGIDQDSIDGWKLEGLDFPSFRLSLLAKVMDRLTIRSLSGKSELSIAEWRVLSRLALSSEGLTVRQVAAKAWVDRAEVSRAARALESRGLIARRSNPADLRAPVLYVTDAGAALYKPVMALRTAFHAEVMRSFSTQELEEFDALLAKLAVNLLNMTDAG